MKKLNGTNEILKHLEKFGVTDKDTRVQYESTRGKKCDAKKAKHRRYKLDLHGLTSIEAARSLRITLESCRQRGIREVLVIHGKGYHSDTETGPVLKGLVFQMLENELAGKIRSFRPARLKDGGEGATLVLLQ